MTLSKKMQRAMYGPSFLEVTFGLILSIILGVLLAAVFLVFKPVQIVKELPQLEERVVGAVYFVEGTHDATRAKAWRNKRQQLLEGLPGTITLTEDEINAWLAADLGGSTASAAETKDAKGKSTPAKSAKAPEKTPDPAQKDGAAAPAADGFLGLSFVPAAPQVRIADSFQVGAHGTLHYAGSQFPLVVQAQGHFRKQGELFVYQPDKLFIGSLPIHCIPGALNWGVDKLVGAAANSESLPENAKTVWKKVSDVAVEGRQVKVVIQ